jgi:outer membrane protein OmpA-like peptidoglycan-associated protein
MAGGSGSGNQAFASTLTDLMTSLAVIFILLLVVFLKQSHDQSKKAKEEVTNHLEEFLKQEALALKQDPEDPLKMTVMVGEQQLRFPVGGYALSAEGGQFIGSFFKNFATKVCGPTLRDKVDSIVIEGHTDTSGEKTPDGVRGNIVLSQKRSYSVLDQALKSVQLDPETYECLLKLASATGRGSRSPVMVNNEYNPDLSRRVEIKIRVKSAEQQFRKLAEQALVNSVKVAPPAAQSAPAPAAEALPARPASQQLVAPAAAVPAGLAPAPAVAAPPPIQR